MTGSRWVALVLVVALMALAACGDNGDAEAPDDDAAQQQTPDEGDCATEEEIETESGLRYEDLECGSGAEAEANSIVVVHYVGTLENGEKFDSSLDRGQPAIFPLGAGQLIAGFEEGLRGMKEGGRRRIVIPPDLGYGPSGQPPVIPPDATLIFTIELLEVRES